MLLLFNCFFPSSFVVDVPTITCMRELVKLPPVIVFKKNSTAYVDAIQEERLYLFFSNYRSLDNPAIKILLGYHSCNDEAFHDNFIGYKRAEKIIEYGVRKWEIKRKSVFIRDVSSDYVESGTCERPSISVSIIY